MIETRVRGLMMPDEMNALIQSPDDGAVALVLSVIRTALEDVERAMRLPLRTSRPNTKAQIAEKSKRGVIQADAHSAAEFLDGDAVKICTGLGFHSLPNVLRQHCRKLASYRAEIIRQVNSTQP